MRSGTTAPVNRSQRRAPHAARAGRLCWPTTAVTIRPAPLARAGKWPRPDGSRSARPHTRTRRPPLMTVRGGSSSCRTGRERQYKHQTAGFPGHQIGARRPGSQRAARLPNAPDLHDRLIHRRSCVWRSTHAVSSGYAASWAGSTPTSHPPGRQSSSRQFRMSTSGMAMYKYAVDRAGSRGYRAASSSRRS